MNCTPFALFTLLCTLATSMVAAGNASRRAGVDHILAKTPAGEVVMTGYLLSFEAPKPAVSETGWMSIDLQRIRNNVLEKLPAIATNAKAIAAQASALKDVPPMKAIGVAATKAGIQGVEGIHPSDRSKVVGQATAAVGKSAPVQPRVTSIVKPTVRWQLPAGSPLRGAGEVETMVWRWESAPTRQAGRLTVLSAHSVATPKLTVTVGALSGSQPIRGAGITNTQAYWTPALHVAENGQALLGSYYAAPDCEPSVGTIEAISRELGGWMERLPEVRQAAASRFLSAWGWDISWLEVSPVQSAGRPGTTQK